MISQMEEMEDNVPRPPPLPLRPAPICTQPPESSAKFAGQYDQMLGYFKNPPLSGLTMCLRPTRLFSRAIFTLVLPNKLNFLRNDMLLGQQRKFIGNQNADASPYDYYGEEGGNDDSVLTSGNLNSYLPQNPYAKWRTNSP